MLRVRKNFSRLLSGVASKPVSLFRRAPFLAPLLVIAIFLTATLPTLTAASIWFDEAFSAYIIRYDFAEIWNFTAADVHPPLYYFALKIWSQIFGSSDFALRSMSVFFGVLAILAGCHLVSRMFGGKTAAVSTLLLAVSPMFVRYAQEVRMYTLVVFLSMLAVRAYFELYLSDKKLSKVQSRSWSWLLVAACALGLWTQYLSALTLVALWIWRLFEKKSKLLGRDFVGFLREYFGGGWLVINLLIMGLFSPWMPFFFRQAGYVSSDFWIPEVNFDTILNFVSNFFTFLDFGVNGWIVSGVVCAVLAVIMLGVSKAEKMRNLKFILALAVFPPVVLFVLSLSRSIFMDRYLISSMAFLAIFIGVVAREAFRRSRCLGVMIFLSVVSIFIYGNLQINNQLGFSKIEGRTNDAKQMMVQIEQKTQGSIAPVVVPSGLFFYEVAHYETTKNPVFTPSDHYYGMGSLKMIEYSPAKIDSLVEFSSRYDEVWVVYDSDVGEVRAPLLKDWRLVLQEVLPDNITGEGRYLIQKFSTK